MSNIQGYLQNIMQAVYGKDVRQSIHDAIETIDSVADTAQNSATASASRAANSEKAAKASETAAKASETNAKTSETAAANSEKAAKASETAAKASETNAKTSETVAANSEEAARVSETAAKASETNAKEKADAARQSADIATEKAEIATQKAEEITGESEAAADSATKAQSYAVGGTGSRDGEDTDNAQYYYEQIKRVSQGLNGIIPMGTVAFADLPVSGMENGWMYNISDDFTSDDRFNDGGGIFYGKGNNVIWTSEGKWDVTAGSGVTGIKGNKEKTYRQGNVNLTPEQIGAVAEDGDASDTTVAFASSDTPDADASAWTSVATLESGEKHVSLFSKISQMFKNTRYLYKMLGTTDISRIGGGTVTGAIASQNEALATLNTNLTWKFYRNISGADTGFASLPTDFTELMLHVIWLDENDARNALHIPILSKELQTAVSQIRTGYYANSTANAMINMYVSLTKIKVAQVYVDGSSALDNIVVGIYYR